MIDQLRAKLDHLGENYVEKGAHFKIKVIPFFCAIHIKKDHKNQGLITFYSNQLIEIFLAVMFLLFGLMLFDTDAGFTHGPIHIVIAVLLSFNLILKQIAIEGLKTRLALCPKLENSDLAEQGH
ncbi:MULTISPECIES: hypothetical protein [Pseudoalteromonas]|jgi:hypothetical protein|uniref:Uncharacterized protein n=1 Tax=Pseudoalteromonas lipolytica TaxID=570156 RepID=A0AAD0WEK1_9GAMM|nr:MULTISPECIES: hypothetical protein [Pseudoalteromonas]AXV67540.1 hypothetical protein D0907_19775 [Pseudoalteromonas donghaensis]EWH05332.1 hypothetical protein AT00_13700 [Pseudoalteromonas lipolytica SCSIO 04301]MBE0352932.1 hypothetical protein [Pseudoalteromonas lipolytica LMEB 39]MCC9662040.1 hypothetical protein [Pseudoalteromonas sp. MB41]QLJ10038.1 hypothetical protein GZH31_18590 [Pseudoalteromonas sp. JSTW]|tara:strand:- start:4618 stop:4989 length:372 start_codon:yes stop_codon:yes gene_type:complete